MANKTKYRRKYAQMLIDYFTKYLDMRELQSEAEKGQKKKKLPEGYPTFTKFARSLGVTARTLRNWRDENPEFAEAMEFASEMQDDILDERGLIGVYDGRTAMKIRELKASKAGADGGAHLVISLNDDRAEEKIEIKRWTEEVHEDVEY